MPTIRQLVATAALAAAAVSTSPRAAAAQDAGPQPYRFTIGGYLSYLSMDSDASSRTGMGGFGARAMFNRSDVARAARSLFDRASAGAFWTHSKKGDVSSDHVGGEVDVSLLQTPANGIFDPFVSLGAGIFHTSVPGPRGGTSITSNDFALTPAVGARIPFFSGIGARADLRLPIVFGNSTSMNIATEGGIYFSF